MTMQGHATQIAHRLGQSAEAVCRQYLSKGVREGRYWLVGDAHNAPGRSLYVRLVDMEKGPAGKWTDAATGEHGDLLDLIALNQRHHQLRDTLDEARHFLSLPQPSYDDVLNARAKPKAPAGSPQAARRLFAASKPIMGTMAEAYLRNRAITSLCDNESLRFHPHCFYRPSDDDGPGTMTAWPAMIAAITDLDGQITGVHRTYLSTAVSSADGTIALVKAPVAIPHRAMGNLLGAGVRFGKADDVMVAGEGIETVRSLKEIMPAMPMIAATSSAHLAAILFPPTLRRLYVARDNDPAGLAAVAMLMERAGISGIELIPLVPERGDYNDDLREIDAKRLRAALRVQLAPQDVGRFLVPPR
jgi:hypothetical protein